MLNRRGFLRASTAACAATGLIKAPDERPDWLKRLLETGRLVGERIVIEEPIDLRGIYKNFLITSCTITMPKSFAGDVAFKLDHASSLEVSNCFIISEYFTFPGHIDWLHATMSDVVIGAGQ